MDINLNKNIDLIKSIINNQIKENKTHIFLELEFNENKNIKKDNFDLEYVKKLVTLINKSYPNINFEYKLTYIKNNNFSMNTSQCLKLEEINNYLIDNFNQELLLRKEHEVSRSFTFQSVINANREIDKIINKVNQAKEKFPNISTFEQFMILYEEVTDFIYKEEERYDQLNSSHWISVVNGDTIVCTGYASLLGELSNRIFDKKDLLILENDVDVFDKRSDELVSAHSNNVIFIKDEKYNINGLFYLDSCWDSIENNNDTKAYSYCCIPLKDISNHKIFDFHFRKVYQYNLKDEYDTFFHIKNTRNFISKLPLIKSIIDIDYLEDKNSLNYYINNYDSLNNQSIVPIEAYVNAFKIIGFQKGLTKEELKEFIKERIEKSIEKTKYYFNIKNCNNVFAKEAINKQKKMH